MGPLDASLTALILAGGRSTRLGADKALLRASTGETLIERTVRLAAPLCDRVFIVVNSTNRALPDSLPATVLVDHHPNQGPLAGLQAGLAAAATPRCLALSCDLPLLQPDLLGLLASYPGPYDALVPRIDSRPQPLLAVYARAVLPLVEQMLAAGDLRLTNLLARVHTHYMDEADLAAVDPQLHSFHNLNTAADLARARALGF